MLFVVVYLDGLDLVADVNGLSSSLMSMEEDFLGMYIFGVLGQGLGVKCWVNKKLLSNKHTKYEFYSCWFSLIGFFSGILIEILILNQTNSQGCRDVYHLTTQQRAFK